MDTKPQYGPHLLSAKNVEAMKYAALGFTCKEAAAILGKSWYTVRAQREQAVRLLNARNVTHAVFLLTANGEFS